jgi:hypothetical protein
VSTPYKRPPMKPTPVGDDSALENMFPLIEPIDMSSGVLPWPWAHPQWTRLGAQCQVREHGGVDLNTRGWDADEIDQLRAVECRCARCGDVMHPFRARTPSPKTLVVSCTCSKPRCSRSRAAREARTSIRAEIIQAFVRDLMEQAEREAIAANEPPMWGPEGPPKRGVRRRTLERSAA